AQSAAFGRDVGDGSDFHAPVNRQQFHGFAHQRMPDTVNGARLLGPGVGDADLLVELLVDGDVDELVDGRGNDGAAKLAIERRQVGAAADQTAAQRGGTNDHGLTFPGSALPSATRHFTASPSVSQTCPGRAGCLPSWPAAPVRTRIERSPAFFAVCISVVVSPMS